MFIVLMVQLKDNTQGSLNYSGYADLFSCYGYLLISAPVPLSDDPLYRRNAISLDQAQLDHLANSVTVPARPSPDFDGLASRDGGAASC